MNFNQTQLFSDCSPGWTYHFQNNYTPNIARCYKHFPEEKTWTDARSFCLSVGQTNGDLASIPDHTTNEFLTTLSTKISYIGASDLNLKGTWIWTDGTPWNFEKWAPGQPDNNNGPQNFVTINYHGVGLWDDDTETYPRPFFCQYDLGK